MNELVIMKDKQAVTSSLQVAETFGKNHRDVLRAIDDLKDVRNFAQMFSETNLPDSYGRNRRGYYMNRDGFTLLAMGFTGTKALEFKLKYIEAFNAMEETLIGLPMEKIDPVKQAEIEMTKAKTHQANALYRIAMKTESHSSQQSILARAAESITGEMTIPIMKDKEFSAGQVGEQLGISANMVGRIANRIGLKAEQPGQNEYGRWSNSKSQHSDKEVAQRLYTEAGLKLIDTNRQAGDHITESVLEQGILDLVNQAVKRGFEAGQQNDYQLLTRKELCEQVLNIDVNTFDDHFRYQPGFPSFKDGKLTRYYVPAVHEWIMNHQTEV